ncbi:MAG: F0F1 ATP synthase subunit A [Firmicutes bacterium]|nr:F0F1 ATP synthase subunit A [Bacillota bacterium]
MDLEFSVKTMFYLGKIPVTETVVSTWLIMAVLVIGSFLVTRRFKTAKPGETLGTTEHVVELLVDGLYSFIGDVMGPKGEAFIPYMATLLLFLVCANLIGLLGFRPPTADLNTTLGFATMSFILIQGNGIRSQGLFKFIKGLFEPFVFLFPLNVIGEIATPFSMAFRLFGNILGGMIIMALLYGFAPIAIPVLPHIYFDLFSGIIQAFIFTMLTMVFVAMAIDEDEEEEN